MHLAMHLVYDHRITAHRSRIVTPAAAAEPDMALPPPLQYRSLRRSLYATVFVTMDVRT